MYPKCKEFWVSSSYSTVFHSYLLRLRYLSKLEYTKTDNMAHPKSHKQTGVSIYILDPLSSLTIFKPSINILQAYQVFGIMQKKKNIHPPKYSVTFSFNTFRMDSL